MTSLVKRQKLKVLYRRGDSERPVEKIICPAKLFLFKGELYFVCQSEKHDFFLKICRILKAELLEETFIADSKRLKGIEKRLAASFGILDEKESKPRKVVVRFPDSPYYRLIFSEKKFHHSQRISTGKKGELLLTMEAPIGLDLVNWVLAWPEGEVGGPEELREELGAVGQELTKKYNIVS
jgi:predicted DNA-binding transcriptional regulator YafY